MDVLVQQDVCMVVGEVVHVVDDQEANAGVADGLLVFRGEVVAVEAETGLAG